MYSKWRNSSTLQKMESLVRTTQIGLPMGHDSISTSTGPYLHFTREVYLPRQLSLQLPGQSVKWGNCRERLGRRTLTACSSYGNGSEQLGTQIGFVKLDPLQGPLKRSTLRTSPTSRPLDMDGESSVPAKVADIVDKVLTWFDAFWRFTRPHTIIGSGLSVTSVSLLAIQSQADVNAKFIIGLLQAIIPALCMNVYIVGLNQIYDIEIDKVNKPYLPLASGEFSVATGTALVTTFAAMSLVVGVYVGSSPLLWALTVSLLLGTAYSADFPLFRWKNSAVAAASCILAIRAVVVQLCFYLHMQVSVLGRTAYLTKPLWFAIAFMSFFSVVIALAKDIPDVEGDKVFGVHTFSVRLGQKRVFWMCVGLLQTAYAAAIVTGLRSPVLWSKAVVCTGHAIMAGTLWERSATVDLTSRGAITSWYMFIWKLFYTEYLLLPLMR